MNIMKTQRILVFAALLISLTTPVALFAIPPGLPQVSITASNSPAIEPGPYGGVGVQGTNVAIFTITRSGGTNDLIVYLVRGGTATGPIINPENPCTFPNEDYLISSSPTSTSGHGYYIRPCNTN